MNRARLLRRTAPSILLALLAPASTAQFAVDNSVVPGGAANASSTENVDFGDVDGDGDWDVALANGGDDGDDQNRLWINRGGLQGGAVGTFADVTAIQLPAIADDSRDIELADIDGDADLDLFTSNTSDIAAQTNRWWINLGGIQGGSAGFYNDQTFGRWVGLAGPGSSVAAWHLIPSGGFVEWSCDSDFGDLDGDGDLDLVQSSCGPAIDGLTPTRIFLNDGAGFFSELNPMGVADIDTVLPDGAPALWCEGLQLSDTTDASGASADIATSAIDVDLGDVDGDLDLDILLGARDELPRLFVNRLVESGGTLSFRDATGAAFPNGYSNSQGHYEQEMGDLDGDGDLDVYGVNYRAGGPFGLDKLDLTMLGNGDGTFGGLKAVPGSGDDDTEVDFLDYDNDGDLDAYVANFAGQDRLYRNTLDGGSQLGFVQASLPAFSATSLDADACDVDGDGDYDLLVAEDNFQANTLLRNTTDTPDVHAPSLFHLEELSDAIAFFDPRPVRVQVYDNSPYYLTWYDETRLEVTVDGVSLPPFPMQSSGGQVFRGELPGNLTGSVTYRAVSEDPYGNTGVSETRSYASTGFAGALFGVGSSSSVGEPTISALSFPTPGRTLWVAGGNAPPDTVFGFLALSADFTVPLDLGGGIVLNVLPTEYLLLVGPLDENGHLLLEVGVPPGTDGAVVFCQFGLVDASFTFASSKGLALVVQ